MVMTSVFFSLSVAGLRKLTDCKLFNITYNAKKSFCMVIVRDFLAFLLFPMVLNRVESFPPIFSMCTWTT